MVIIIKIHQIKKLCNQVLLMIMLSPLVMNVQIYIVKDQKLKLSTDELSSNIPQFSLISNQDKSIIGG